MNKEICNNEFWECRASIWIWKTLPIIFMIVGTIGNIFNIIVLSRRELRKHSTSVYMLVLAISDTVTLWTFGLESTLRYGYGLILIDMSNIQCKIARWAAYGSGGLSTWTVANLTFERVIATRFPLWAKTRITPKTAIVVTAVTFVVIQALVAHLIYGHELKTVTLYNNTTGITVVEACYFLTPVYQQFFLTTWTKIALFVFNVAPMAVIITGNAIIGISLLLRQKPGELTNIANNNNDTIRQKSAIRTLFGISIFFVICTTPFCLYLLFIGKQRQTLFTRAAAVDRLTYAVINQLLLINYTFNFFLYFHRATFFRQQFHKTFGALKRKLVLCLRGQGPRQNVVYPMNFESTRMVVNVLQRSSQRESLNEVVPRPPYIQP